MGETRGNGLGIIQLVSLTTLFCRKSHISSSRASVSRTRLLACTIPTLTLPCERSRVSYSVGSNLLFFSPVGINVAATWDKNLINQHDKAMGAEHRSKGIVLEPVKLLVLGMNT